MITFDRRGYVDIIERAQGYRIVPMCECRAEGPLMILRHDVDISLECALALARLEREMGVRSSYFILLHNEFYNPLSLSGRELVRQIHDCGHEIGLHWDSRIYRTQGEFDRGLKQLSEIVGEDVRSASQHIPTDTPSMQVVVEFEAYNLGDRFQYVSDSNTTWRGYTPVDLIERGVDFQFLAHPIWWIAEGNSWWAKLEWAARRAGDKCWDNMRQFISYTHACLADRDAMDARLARSDFPV